MSVNDLGNTINIQLVVPFNRLTSTQVVVLFVVTINHDEQLCDRVLGLDWYLLSSAGHYIIWIPYNCVNSHCSDKYTTNE